MRYVIKTFGCKVNQCETSAIREAMREHGFEEAVLPGEADVFIVNSCAVTDDSAKKALREIRRIKRTYPGKPTVLTGCFPQAFPEAARESGADIVTGTSRRAEIPEKIISLAKDQGDFFDIPKLPREYEELPHANNGEKTRGFLKIEDGCDRFCSYCVIPNARGRVRSRSLASVKEEAERFAEEGRREIVLIGINLSCYGKDCGLTLADAVEAVCGVEKIARVRLSSLEPELLDEKMLARLAAQEKLCPHFHLSLQSGCDETLRRMNRRYTSDEFFGIVCRLRELFPNCAVTTDMMAGFAGETEEEFAASLAFAEKVQFARIHAFSYSLREGTAAAKLPGHLPEAIKAERFRRLSELDEKLHQKFLLEQVGTVQSVLVQKRVSPDFAFGLTPNYTPVRLYGSSAARHELISVKITGAEAGFCTGTAICP